MAEAWDGYLMEQGCTGSAAELGIPVNAINHRMGNHSGKRHTEAKEELASSAENAGTLSEHAPRQIRGRFATIAWDLCA